MGEPAPFAMADTTIVHISSTPPSWVETSQTILRSRAFQCFEFSISLQLVANRGLSFWAGAGVLVHLPSEPLILDPCIVHLQ